MEFWIDGSWCTETEARIPVLDHGLLYGDGVFEGIRSYGGRCFYLDAHLDRLERSAAALELAPNTTRAQWTAICEEAAGRLGDGYLRLIVTRGTGDLGIDPRSCPVARTILIGGGIAVTDAAAAERGLRLVVSRRQRPGPDVLDGRVKSLNYLPSVLARIEARRAGADEALLLNAHGRVAEATAENLCCVVDGVLVSPPASEGGLEGITRAVVLALARRLGLEVAERALPLAELERASEVLLTGTGAELLSVARIGDTRYQLPGPVTRQLSAAFADHARGLAARREAPLELGPWLTPAGVP